MSTEEGDARSVSPRTIYAVAVLSCLLHCGFGGSRVTVSLFAIHQNASPATIGALMSLLALFPTLLAVPLGRLSDRIGARKPALIGSAGVALGLLLPACLPSLSTLFVAVLLLGTSFTFYQVAISNLVGALGEPKDRTHNYSILSLGFASASFIGPLIAGFGIDHLGHRWTFFVLMLCALVPLVAVGLRPRILPDIAKKSGEKRDTSVFDLLKIPHLRDVFIVGGVLSAAWDLYQFLLPLYAHSLGFSASVIGMILATFSLAIFAVRTLIPALSRRFGDAAVITGAILMCGIAFIAFPFCTNPWLIAGVSVLLGFGVGAGQPIAMTLIYNHSPPGRQGEATGVRVSVNNLAHVTVPLFFGSVGTALGYLPIFLVNAAALMACAYISKRNFMR